MAIIKLKQAEVQAELCDGPIEIIVPGNNKTRAESIPEEVNVLPTGFLDGELMEAKKLKKHISFRALLELDEHQVQKRGRKAKCCCPFHPDNTPSFFINETDDYANCYGCGWHGDVFKYEGECHKVDFKLAWRSLNAVLRKEPRIARKSKPAPKREKPQEEPDFTAKQLEERKRYADRLATVPWFAELVCERRFVKTGDKWNPETIRQLAKGGFLGWADCLAFIYPRGTKYRRWPEKEFYWESEGSSLWRGELLAGAEHVYLTESETDAIALLDSGIEQKKPNCVVVALSGVNSFPPGAAVEFKGKIVTFCFDNDKAGEMGVEKITPLLAPHVKKLRSVDLKEVA